jgi:hypothetical protein
LQKTIPSKIAEMTVRGIVSTPAVKRISVAVAVRRLWIDHLYWPVFHFEAIFREVVLPVIWLYMLD